MFEDAFDPADPPSPMAVLTALERLAVGLAAVVVRGSPNPLEAYDQLQVAARDHNPPPPGPEGDQVEYALQQMLATVTRLAS